MRQLEAPALRAWLDGGPGPVTLLDVREPWEVALCRLDGSVNIPLGQLPSRLAELDPARPTVVNCHHGMRSQQAAEHFLKKGFTNVWNLRGGIDAWSTTVDPKVPRY